MAHERELVPAPLMPADDGAADDRWPVPYALLFVTVASVTLWTLIMLAAEWLLG
jgi:hypothetical protein